MIEADSGEIWAIIICLGIGTFLIRFSFLGLVGDRPLPGWALRLLRYTPVAVLPAVASPMIFGSGEHAAEPLRLVCAALTVIVGIWTRSVLWAIVAGLGLFFGLGAILQLS
ncbi:AzlD domain-containing protein [Celeribacter indicus]|uniref:AzlD branched-chain amino acid transport n=1 Tax=Celeribacter indicus TaxID=1208324 RepID=A0A0B5DZU3_9RHOB|nr:AzlD domain-containing protein [Celeribacter indicus]AJE48983.1 AzlD branched-chain amino acid transport [Celeribacter indicus]SDW42936.1 Branched-chain amino acid transport protein [Celeribacter indicus]